jgi:hypothetical protein
MVRETFRNFSEFKPFTVQSSRTAGSIQSLSLAAVRQSQVTETICQEVSEMQTTVT